MPLKQEMTHDEVLDYLTNDLRKSIRMDVYPAIQIGNPEGRPSELERRMKKFISRGE